MKPPWWYFPLNIFLTIVCSVVLWFLFFPLYVHSITGPIPVLIVSAVTLLVNIVVFQLFSLLTLFLVYKGWITTKPVELAINLIFLFFLAWFANAAIDELVSNPRSWYHNEDGKGVIRFNLDVPTSTTLIILVFSVLGVFSSCMIWLIKLFNLSTRTKIFWIIVVLSLVACFVSAFVAFNHFFTHASPGV